MAHTKSIVIPSLIEALNSPMQSVADSLENGIQLFEMGSGYLIGKLALTQGVSPYRNINSSPEDIDYQLLAKAAILAGTGASTGEVTLTTGFPFATFELYKQAAADFFTPKDIQIEYNAGTFSSADKKRVQITVKKIDVMPEVQGSVMAIRKGKIADKNNFFIVSLGYGTCETALSTDSGLVARTCLSTNGLRYAVNSLYKELARTHNVGLKNEHVMNQSFQSGHIVIDRKRKDLTELRKKQLLSYYQDIISPTIRKAFLDSDYEKATSLYLVGGGAMYPEIVKSFQDEFGEVLDVTVPEDPHNTASLGYYLNSVHLSGDSKTALGIDIGNAYTVVTRQTEEETKKEKPMPVFSSTEL